MLADRSTCFYDVVIIGAGIGGLVCGCYLAKAGLRVLIAEQQHKPGGYCTSFRRKGFTFDAAAHSIGGLRQGNLSKIFSELEIDKKINLTKFDPSNVIVTPDHRISFWSDTSKTISEFKAHFPDQAAGIDKFFKFLLEPSLESSTNSRNQTFDKLLDNYFSDEKLKGILSFPLILNGGLPPSLISTFIASKIFKEFLLGGGYYPEGGIQVLSDVLAERFKELGGELRLSCSVNKIETEGNIIKGVRVNGNAFIASRYVVSNCDARQTFLRLLGEDHLEFDFIEKLNNMTPSLSAFVLYLGTDGHLEEVPEIGTNLWFLSTYDLDAVYRSAEKGDFDDIKGYLLFIYPDKRRILAFISAPFKNELFWKTNKGKFTESLLKQIETDAIPHLSKNLEYIDAATPSTLFRYTGNYQGAAFGWACTPSQLALTDFRKPSFVKNLYLSGHWATKGLGIPGVAYIGCDTAGMIIRKEKIGN